MKSNLIFLICLLICSFISFSNNKVTTFTYHSKQSDKDRRFEYDTELLKLALDKTVDKYGPYELKPLNYIANYKRIEKLAANSNFPNLFYKHSVTNNRVQKMGYVPYPVDKGIVGFRVAFVSHKNKEKLSKISNIEDLKKFLIVQGLGWSDNDILRFHGFNILEASNYEGMFTMITINRAELFFRGANEIYKEWMEYQHTQNLSYDENLILYYPLPRFFFTNKKNTAAIKRVQEGLLIADADGSIDELWMKHYGESLEFINFSKRKILSIENPFITEIDNDYEKYNYTFEELKNLFK